MDVCFAGVDAFEISSLFFLVICTIATLGVVAKRRRLRWLDGVFSRCRRLQRQAVRGGTVPAHQRNEEGAIHEETSAHNDVSSLPGQQQRSHHYSLI